MIPELPDNLLDHATGPPVHMRPDESFTAWLDTHQDADFLALVGCNSWHTTIEAEVDPGRAGPVSTAAARPLFIEFVRKLRAGDLDGAVAARGLLLAVGVIVRTRTHIPLACDAAEGPTS